MSVLLHVQDVGDAVDAGDAVNMKARDSVSLRTRCGFSFLDQR